jgi:hypothetical protein
MYVYKSCYYDPNEPPYIIHHSSLFSKFKECKKELEDTRDDFSIGFIVEYKLDEKCLGKIIYSTDEAATIKMNFCNAIEHDFDSNYDTIIR